MKTQIALPRIFQNLFKLNYFSDSEATTNPWLEEQKILERFYWKNFKHHIKKDLLLPEKIPEMNHLGYVAKTVTPDIIRDAIENKYEQRSIYLKPNDKYIKINASKPENDYYFAYSKSSEPIMMGTPLREAMEQAGEIMDLQEYLNAVFRNMYVGGPVFDERTTTALSTFNNKGEMQVVLLSKHGRVFTKFVDSTKGYPLVGVRKINIVPGLKRVTESFI